MKNNSRRGFMGKAFGAVAGVGAVASLYAMKRSWDPLPSVKAAGFTTLDMSAYKENELVVEKWRGKPIFVLKQSEEMTKKAQENPKDIERLIKVGDAYFMVTIGLCTHLGCIPGYNSEEESFLCACHGGTYDYTGEVTKAPPPRGLDIPPFKIDGMKLVLGEEGPEYKKMKETGVTL
ncbi:ubiquinol-cytochrome c reductase iron-sulfur subunit [Sulfurimonas autotrophica]|uniref:Ubiquinol-cytochrome c reductase, iron-sulfur subunit n=1 Tax=Sulfurimonas autotrophica (strain ATCC BAA-671 / DSM 16294 / JCM 11897 / OK10) TaxID=563040 RepID=E0UR15_SULAO|nr:ubiquinol-cytochrome c reductase iron-sulfur subunit [Sulfurimonas autotrophica]ADN09971.1 ubiquinol-cytochrome c reductase, iron-sulfur subunit [Sulfurimonas autotrophica DSM 16294]